MSGTFTLMIGEIKITAPNTMEDEDVEPLMQPLEDLLETQLGAVASLIRQKFPNLTVKVVV